MTTIEQCTVPSGLVIPANIPGDDLKPYKLEEVATTLRTAGSSTVTQAEAAEASWAGLPDERVWVSPRETKEYEGNGLAVVSTTGSYTLQNEQFARVPHPPGAHDIQWPGGP